MFGNSISKWDVLLLKEGEQTILVSNATQEEANIAVNLFKQSREYLSYCIVRVKAGTRHNPLSTRKI